MKELNDVNHNIPHEIKVIIAAKTRDFLETANVSGDKDINVFVEVYNDKDILRDPTHVGITVFYPNKERTTHMLTKTFPVTIDQASFSREVILLKETLIKKAKGE